MRLVDGDVEPGFFRILDGEDLLLRAVEVEGFQPQILTDAVLYMDDEVAFLQLRPVRRLRQLMELAAGTNKFVATEDLGVGDDRKFGVRPKEPAGQRCNRCLQIR